MVPAIATAAGTKTVSVWSLPPSLRLLIVEQKIPRVQCPTVVVAMAWLLLLAVLGQTVGHDVCCHGAWWWWGGGPPAVANPTQYPREAGSTPTVVRARTMVIRP